MDSTTDEKPTRISTREELLDELISTKKDMAAFAAILLDWQEVLHHLAASGVVGALPALRRAEKLLPGTYDPDKAVKPSKPRLAKPSRDVH